MVRVGWVVEVWFGAVGFLVTIFLSIAGPDYILLFNSSIEPSENTDVKIPFLNLLIVRCILFTISIALIASISIFWLLKAANMLQTGRRESAGMSNRAEKGFASARVD